MLPVVGRFIRSILLPSSSRSISTSRPSAHGEFEYKDPTSEDEVVNITYVLRDGTKKHIRGKVGDNVMYLAHRCFYFNQLSFMLIVCLFYYFKFIFFRGFLKARFINR